MKKNNPEFFTVYGQEHMIVDDLAYVQDPKTDTWHHSALTPDQVRKHASI